MGCVTAPAADVAVDVDEEEEGVVIVGPAVTFVVDDGELVTVLDDPPADDDNESTPEVLLSIAHCPSRQSYPNGQHPEPHFGKVALRFVLWTGFRGWAVAF